MMISISALAQGAVRPEDARRGDESERYLRARSRLSVLDGPWTLDTASRSSAWGRWLGGELEISHNSGLPITRADGPAWGGRGLNARASGTLELRRGLLHVRLAPVAWYAMNSAFTLVPTSGPFPWSDAARPISIDLPQRHGDQALGRLDAGESELALEWTHARVALTSGAAHLGAGADHAIIAQGDAGGFPRIEAGFPHGVRTRFGEFAAQVAWGRQPQTAWAPERRDGALYSSYLVAAWKPPVIGDRIELGVARFFSRDWGGLQLRDLLVPFGSVHSSGLVGGDSAADNQLASIFARLRVQEAGLEFFGEFGKNDRSKDLRDQAVELEHNAAWLLGVNRSWRTPGDRLWSLALTGASGSISPITRFRDQAFFYEHFPLSQGHTVRGQLLGTPLLEREGGAELRVDRYDPRGRVGVRLRTRALPNERAESVPERSIRQEWMLMTDWMRFTRAGSVTLSAGGVADLGYSPGTGDVYSLHLAVGFSTRK